MAREIYYLVLSVSTATGRNECCAGEVHMHYYGKGNYHLFADYQFGGVGSPIGNINLLTPHFVREYGYKRQCDAVRNWVYKNPENTKYWTTENRIVRAWVRKDNKVMIEP